ncbi:MAG: hypothetical protein WCF57_02660 [Pyrinomonadaceae bacterium]
MKKIIIVVILAIAAVSSLAAWQTRGRRGKSRDGKQALYDFRRQTRGNFPRLAPAAERRILSAVFNSYLKEANECRNVENLPDSNDYLAAARKAGQFVPDVVAMATGSFTVAGERQTAYIISVNECNASHADNNGTKRLAVFSGQKLVADVDTDFKREILRTTDLNNDGVNELLLGGGDMNQGIEVGVAALVDLQDGKLRMIKDFGKTEENSCASGLSDSNAMASVIFYIPSTSGKMPDFHVDNFRAKCLPNDKLARWQFLSSGPMPEQ